MQKIQKMQWRKKMTWIIITKKTNLERKYLWYKQILKKSRIQTTLGPLLLVWFKSSDTISWVQVSTMTSSLHHESWSIPWFQVNTNIPSLYDESKSLNESKFIPSDKGYLKVQGWKRYLTTNPMFLSWVPVNTNSQSLYHESKFMSSGKAYLKVPKGPWLVNGK